MTDSSPEPLGVSRIARRRASPGHEHEYEELVREMFGLMKQKPGFLGADLIPPESEGGLYHVVVKYANESDMAAWDNSVERSEILARMELVTEGELQHRRLSGLEAWFEPSVVPASMQPPRHRMGLVTWFGIWPTASLFIYLLGTVEVWSDGAPLLGPVPFLLRTAIITFLIAATMTYVVMPRLTPWFRGFLTDRSGSQGLRKT